MNILVSACLLGVNCKYNGGNNQIDSILELGKEHTLIPVCPEQLGGLPTPRISAEIVEGRVINKEGTDVTEQYQKGAEEVLKIAKLTDCKCAILQDKSPSCGSTAIYDGTFTKTLIKGKGVTAKLLAKHDIQLID